METTTYRLSDIFDHVAKASNIEVQIHALRLSVNRFVGKFNSLKKNIGRNWEKIVGFLDQDTNSVLF